MKCFQIILKLYMYILISFKTKLKRLLKTKKLTLLIDNLPLQNRSIF